MATTVQSADELFNHSTDSLMEQAVSTVYSSKGNKKLEGRGLHTTPGYAADPHKAIVDYIKPYLDELHPGPAKLIVATYRQPEKSKGGIIKPTNYLKEDEFQGVTGMVLKMGPLCFEDAGKFLFGGFKPKQFDWVCFNPQNGRACELHGLHARFIDDACIDGVVDDPEIVW